MALIAAACGSPERMRMEDPVDYVNPLMGTASTYELSTGNTYPAIALPWGMNFWTPQTKSQRGRMDIHIFSDQDQRFEADSPAESVDQRLRLILDHACDHRSGL